MSISCARSTQTTCATTRALCDVPWLSRKLPSSLPCSTGLSVLLYASSLPSTGITDHGYGALFRRGWEQAEGGRKMTSGFVHLGTEGSFADAELRQSPKKGAEMAKGKPSPTLAPVTVVKALGHANLL